MTWMFRRQTDAVVWVKRMVADLHTSTIIFTVGTVVVTFCGYDGRIVRGTQPVIGSLNIT